MSTAPPRDERCPTCGTVHEFDAEWIAESTKWRGRPLTGCFAHYCLDWELPIDETTPEWPCVCTFGDEKLNELKAAKYDATRRGRGT